MFFVYLWSFFDIYFGLRQQADRTEMQTEAILSQTYKEIIEIVPLK